MSVTAGQDGVRRDGVRRDGVRAALREEARAPLAVAALGAFLALVVATTRTWFSAPVTRGELYGEVAYWLLLTVVPFVALFTWRQHPRHRLHLRVGMAVGALGLVVLLLDGGPWLPRALYALWLAGTVGVHRKSWRAAEELEAHPE